MSTFWEAMFGEHVTKWLPSEKVIEAELSKKCLAQGRAFWCWS